MMKPETMPTLDARDAENAAVSPELGTHHGGATPFDEQFRQSRIKQKLFGDAAENLEIGRYRVAERLGAGAMGTVYLAVDTSLERKVAIKILHRYGETHRARMQIEAKALAKLSHPNVVTVHEVGSHEGQLFVAMEYVRGKTLTDFLAEPKRGEEILAVFRQAAAGLAAAHAAGVVHRDFKPDNVLVGDDGRVRVLDFGLARTTGSSLMDEVDDPNEIVDAAEPRVTRTGMVAGTPGYMAPEQFLGARVDGRADQFAFCIALHEALWGQRPFHGETLTELAAAVTEGHGELFPAAPRRQLEGIDRARIEAAVHKGLSSNVDERFGSMERLSTELTIQTHSQPKKPRKNETAVALLAVGCALASVSVALYVSFVREPRVPVPVPAAGVEAASRVETADANPMAKAATAAAAARAQGAPAKCVAGTFRDGDRCSPLAWDAKFVTCTASKCSVPRWIVRRFIDDPEFRNAQGRIVPSKEDGATVGLKLYGVRAGNLMHALGFKVGDMITETAESTDITTFRAKLDASNSPIRLEVPLTRKGSPMTVTLLLPGD